MEIKTIAVAFIILTLIPMVSGTEEYWGCWESEWQPCNEIPTAVSDDGKVIAAGSDTGIVGTFNPDGSLRWAYDTHNKMHHIVFSPDGRYIRTESQKRDLYFFDTDGNFLFRYNHSEDHVRYVPSLDGQSMYELLCADECYQENLSEILQREYYKEEIRQIYPNGTIIPRGATVDVKYTLDLAIAIDSCTIASRDHYYLLVANCTGEILWRVKPKYLTAGLAVSADGEYIALGTQYQILYFNRSGAQLWEYPVDDYARDIRISEDGRTIFAQVKWKELCLAGNGTRIDCPTVPSVPGRINTGATGNENNTFTITDTAGKSIIVNMNNITARRLVAVKPGVTSPVSGAETPPRAASSGSLPAPLPAGIALLAVAALGFGKLRK